MDDATLVKSALDEVGAFDQLYHRYVDRIFRYCYSHTGNPQDAEDLTAQVFLTALEALDRYEERQAFGGWLFGIARNLCAAHHRSRYARAEVTLSPEMESCLPCTMGGSDDSPERAQERKALWACINRVLRDLSRDQQEALRLRFWAKLTAAEIGSVLSKRTGAVKMLIWRGIRDLRRRCVDGNQAS